MLISYGNCTPKFIEKVNRKFSNKKVNINKLGFHAHDNIKLAKKNALKAKKLNLALSIHQFWEWAEVRVT